MPNHYYFGRRIRAPLRLATEGWATGRQPAQGPVAIGKRAAGTGGTQVKWGYRYIAMSRPQRSHALEWRHRCTHLDGRETGTKRDQL